jgi:lipopolysaccharide/colanic/teichoic acid biosynthesis glycosyltransferase
VLLSWLIAFILCLYIVTQTFPVLYKQQRVGKHEKLFYLLKFRTLKNSRGSLGQRRFLLGDFMRRTSLDELPQLWNVINGDMSFVGPRPLPVDYLPLFNIAQRKRHSVRPGITGLAQVNGRTAIPWDKKFKYDLDYINSMSFILDLKIIMKTIVLLLSLKPDISLNEKPFTGNQGHD